MSVIASLTLNQYILNNLYWLEFNNFKCNKFDLQATCSLYWSFLNFNKTFFLDFIDIVKEYDGQLEENPKLFKSEKTGRGPLDEKWIENLDKDRASDGKMCAYKLCKVFLIAFMK